jgi:hypothetical protein
MWLRLTGTSGNEFIVDMSKVAYFAGLETGTRLYFQELIKDVKGGDAFKHINVLERVSEISKAVKAKGAR